MKTKKTGTKVPLKKFYITHITSKNPISKEFKLSKKGKLKRNASAYLSEGEYCRKTFRSLRKFSEFLDGLSSNSAVTYGLFKGKAEGVVVSREKKERHPEKFKTAMTRTREDMKWPAGRGVLFLDYDPGKNEKTLSKKDLLNALKEACHFLKDLEMLWCASASSFITNKTTGETLVGLKGQHIYIVVKNGEQIPEIGQAIEDRLWLAGFGRFDVSRAGHLLERTLIDSSVFQPERLDFVGKIITEKPLAKMKKRGSVIAGEKKVLSAEKILPLTKEEQAKIENLKCIARQEAEKERVEVQARYIKMLVRKLAGKNATKDEIARKKQIVEAALEDQVLYGDFILLSREGKRVKVSDLLEFPDKYHQARFADPLEPEYKDDRRIAYANLKAARPYIFSHAHGGRTFKLRAVMPVVAIARGNLHRVVDQVLKILENEGVVFEDLTGQLMLRVSGEKSCQVRPLWLLDRIARLIRFERFDSKTGKNVAIDPPKKIADIIMEKNGDRKFSVLKGIATAPIITTKGRLIKASGYDEEEGIYLVGAEEFPEIPLNPTSEELNAAYEILRKPFETFPFVDNLSWSVMLAALLTAVIRPCLSTAPGFAFDAPTPGSGKTLLAICVGIIATGSEPELMAPFNDEAEGKKLILSSLLMGRSALVFDNVSEKIDSSSLAAVLTVGKYMDRILGQSENVSLSARALWLFTGNNIEVGTDLSRRILACRIDPKMESNRVWQREFSLDPAKHCLENRKKIVSAALTLFAGYFAAGRPNVAQGRLGSFEDWSDMVRQTIVWLGDQGIGELVDPIKVLDKQAEKDTETEDLGKVLIAWYLAFDEKPKSIRAVLKSIEEHVDKPAELNGLKEAINSVVFNYDNVNRYLGQWISRREGKVVDGLRFVRVEKKSGGVAWWKVEKIDGGLSGNSWIDKPQKKMKAKKKNKTENQPTETTNPLLEND